LGYAVAFTYDFAFPSFIPAGRAEEMATALHIGLAMPGVNY